MGNPTLNAAGNAEPAAVKFGGPALVLTEQQITDAIRACEGIEIALARQDIAIKNIIRIFDNMANGRDPNDGLVEFPATGAT